MLEELNAMKKNEKKRERERESGRVWGADGLQF